MSAHAPQAFSISHCTDSEAVRPHSQSTHQPTREAGQLLPISVTLPAPATLHETPFVDVADGIDGFDADGD